jgi:glutamate synthase (NADPH/NADH) small chain
VVLATGRDGAPGLVRSRPRSERDPFRHGIPPREHEKSFGFQPQDGQFISAAGKDVVVIGGGDTGTDCVGTALRQGAKSVVQFEILPRPPEKRAPDNPWPQWPKIFRTDYGQEEAAAVFGADPRQFVISTTRFVGGENSKRVKELHTSQIEWKKDATGAFAPSPVRGSEKVWPAQLVLLALGFLGPEEKILKDLGIDRDPRSNIKAEHGTICDQRARDFCGGRRSARPEPRRVGHQRRARGGPLEVDRYLMGHSDLP